MNTMPFIFSQSFFASWTYRACVACGARVVSLNPYVFVCSFVVHVSTVKCAPKPAWRCAEREIFKESAKNIAYLRVKEKILAQA